MNCTPAISIILVSTLTLPGAFAQERKEEQEKGVAMKPPTLKELQGLWVVDIDKLADTDHFKKHPDELPSAKKWMTTESLEFSETKILFRYRDKLQDMTIKSQQSGETAISFMTHMKKGDFEVPSFGLRVFRRSDGGLEVRFPNDLITRPLKRKANK